MRTAAFSFASTTTTTTTSRSRSNLHSAPTRLFQSTGPGSGDDTNSRNFDLATLQERLDVLRVSVLEDLEQRPPNSFLSAQDFVRQIMESLHNPYDPLPDVGFRTLLRSSTPAWKKAIYQSVGANENVPIDLVATALGEAIGRPDNQFQLLIGDDTEDSGNSRKDGNELMYQLEFVHEPVDYDDGTCWVEARLRSTSSHKLMVILGWSLVRRPEDGAWLIDGLDWQGTYITTKYVQICILLYFLLCASPSFGLLYPLLLLLRLVWCM